MALPTVPVVLHTMGQETSSGASAVVDIGRNDTLRITLDVASVQGPGASGLLVALDASSDRATWHQVAAFDATVQPARVPRVAAPVDRYVRARWSFVGPGSATFAISGVALRPYANLADLNSLEGIARAFASVSNEAKDRAISKACGRVDDVLSDARYVLPLLEWGDSLRDDVLALVVWQLMSEVVGFNPDIGADDAVRTRFEDAMANLRRGSYAAVVDSTPESSEGGIFVFTEPTRGY